MAEFNTNIWAPWRMEYIRSLGEEAKEDGCFLCHYWDHPDEDEKNRVVWRTASTFVVMNRFPYTNGHLLIAHAAHKADLIDLDDAELTELTRALRDGVELLRKTLGPHGFNIGYNVGQCAGAGLPGHLHAHIVPRWSGDTNFMAVLGDYRIVPDSLDALWAELVENANAAGLRPS
jgi:ATP adenylyltransferase